MNMRFGREIQSRVRALIMFGMVLCILVACGKQSADKKLKAPSNSSPPPVVLPAEVPQPVILPAEAPPPVPAADPSQPADYSTLDINQLNELAIAAEKGGEILKAEQLRIAAVEKAKTVNPLDFTYLDALRTLGFFYHFHGESAKAETVFLDLIKATEEIYGPDDSGVADSIIHLTSVYNIQAKFEFSEPLYTRAISIREKAYGPESEQVEQVLGYYAGCLRSLNKVEEAAEIDKKIGAIQKAREKKKEDGEK